jgi:HAE1 family hydrophobic/amphiphilic exporter-1
MSHQEYKGRLSEVKRLREYHYKVTGNGNFLRIKDVAKVEQCFSITDQKISLWVKSVVVGFQTSVPNAQRNITTGNNVDFRKSKPDFPSRLITSFHITLKTFLDASINKSNIC